jgi:hypothetical protein
MIILNNKLAFIKIRTSWLPFHDVLPVHISNTIQPTLLRLKKTAPLSSYIRVVRETPGTQGGVAFLEISTEHRISRNNEYLDVVRDE